MRNRILDYSGRLLREPRAVLRDASPRGQKQVEQLFQSLGHAIAEKPAVALGVALSVGVVVGWLIKRR